MCPGGQIVPTATTDGGLCVNGMSFSKRDGRWSNSAVVASVTRADWRAHERFANDPMAGAAFQRWIERRAALLGLGLPLDDGEDEMGSEASTPSSPALTAPAQRVADFVARRDPQPDDPPLPATSYRLGIRPAPLHRLYPPALSTALAEGLTALDARLPGFATHPDALLVGAETRTSSPVRLPRSPSTLESIGCPGLLPAGEGAGHAGGIVSAAADGLRVARACLATLGLAAPDAEAGAGTGGGVVGGGGGAAY